MCYHHGLFARLENKLVEILALGNLIDRSGIGRSFRSPIASIATSSSSRRTNKPTISSWSYFRNPLLAPIICCQTSATYVLIRLTPQAAAYICWLHIIYEPHFDSRPRWPGQLAQSICKCHMRGLQQVSTLARTGVRTDELCARGCHAARWAKLQC